jgi:hypothetical protein
MNLLEREIVIPFMLFSRKRQRNTRRPGSRSKFHRYVQPDWAFVSEREEKPYFVRETKSTLDSEEKGVALFEPVNCLVLKVGPKLRKLSILAGLPLVMALIGMYYPLLPIT